MSTITSELKKGALVNLIGVIGKMAAPTFLIVVNRLYGAEVFGIYITTNIAIEIIIAFLTSGFKDGALIFVSKFSSDSDGAKQLYQALSNSFAWSIGLSLLTLIGFFWFGEFFLSIFYEENFSNYLVIMFQFMIFSIPLMAFERIVLAATQGLKIMKYDALNNGWLRPLSLLIFSILFWYIDSSFTGLALAYLSTQLLLFIISLVIFSKELSWKKLFTACKNFEINKELVGFAIPQNINMTLNRFITGIDILMLPLFGFGPKIIGFYGAGTMLIREIRSIKLIFSSAFSPHIVRLHHKGEFNELSKHFSSTSSWIATLSIPTILLMAIFKDWLLIIISPDFNISSSFMFFLLPIPYLYCSFSLAGNVVAMTGHSKLILLNSITVASLNFLFNYLLIPKFGLQGAALSSSIAMFILVSLELIEARYVASTVLRVKDIYRPHLVGLLCLFIIFITQMFFPSFSKTLEWQILMSMIIVGLFLILRTNKKLLST